MSLLVGLGKYVYSGGMSFVGQKPFILLFGLTDVDEMVFFTPSRNTDQGVSFVCEYRGGKPPCVMKVTVVGPSGHHPPAF